MERAQRGLLLPDLAATRDLARRLAVTLTQGSVVLLEGDLGAGKSEFARAVIRALAGTEITVPSPTFTLIQTYDLPSLELSHSDLYRLRDASEVAELALDECWQRGALLVEWPGRVPSLWPAERLLVELAPDPGRGLEARRVRLDGTGRWARIVADLAADADPG